MSPAIEVSGLLFEYPGVRALDDVSFSVAEASVTALVGPNGAGKTTLLRCLAGLEEPLRGRIHVAGVDVLEEPRAVHRRIGYLSDFYGLYDALTVRQCFLTTRFIYLFHLTKIRKGPSSFLNHERRL